MKHTSAIRLTDRQCASLFAALSYLLEAGLSAGDALQTLARDETKPQLRQILETMAAGADSGAPLSGLLETAGCFPAYACRLLAVAEQVGQPVSALQRLSRHYRDRASLRERTVQTLLYPAALLLVLLGVITLLLIWVLPIFQDVYRGLGTELSGLSLRFLDFGRGLGRALPWLGAAAVLLLALIAVPQVRDWLKKPVSDRGLSARLHSARFLEALSLGISCGLTPEASAALASQMADGSRFRERCRRCTLLLEQGSALPQALGEACFLSPADSRLLEAGLRSGHGEEVLQTIARESSRRSEEALESALGRIEPAMVAIACLLVAGVLASVMLPLLDIMNGLGV